MASSKRNYKLVAVWTRKTIMPDGTKKMGMEIAEEFTILPKNKPLQASHTFSDNGSLCDSKYGIPGTIPDSHTTLIYNSGSKSIEVRDTPNDIVRFIRADMYRVEDDERQIHVASSIDEEKLEYMKRGEDRAKALAERIRGFK